MQVTRQEELLSELNRRYLQLGDPTELPTVEPANPGFGDHWYDAEAQCLCIWDGVEWVEIPQD
jgi:hypothetical protein